MDFINLFLSFGFFITKLLCKLERCMIQCTIYVLVLNLNFITRAPPTIYFKTFLVTTLLSAVVIFTIKI